METIISLTITIENMYVEVWCCLLYGYGEEDKDK